MARRVRRGVKARRVVRRFELWSVAKLALVFHLFCWALTVAVMVVLWNIAFRLGTITKLETFLSDFGFSDQVSQQDFRLHGDSLFRAGALAGLGLVALNTFVTVMLAFFYNGVSGLFGGVVVSVLEERPPLSPAERRAVVADSHGDRLALPAGPSDAVDGRKLGRRERRRRERTIEAAAKAERSAVRMASGQAAAPAAGSPLPGTPVLAIPAPSPANGSARKRKRKAEGTPARPESAPAPVAVDVVASDVTASAPGESTPGESPPRATKASKPRNGKARPKPGPKPAAAAPIVAEEVVGPIAEHWANGTASGTGSDDDGIDEAGVASPTVASHP